MAVGKFYSIEKKQLNKGENINLVQMFHPFSFY